MTSAPPQPRQIPIPDSFQFTWANPDDSRMPLHQDRQHAPNPITPLSGWLCENYWSKGASLGFAAAGQPISMNIRRINTYYYNAVVPTVPPDKMDEAGQKAESTLKNAIPVFVDRWENEWLPELRSYHDRWNAFDFAGASNEQLLEHLDWSLDTYVRLWSIHFEVAVPFLVAPSMFYDMYADLIEDAGPMDAYKLMQGIENVSFSAGRDLWALSREAADSSEVKTAIMNTPAASVVSALESSPAGQKFLNSMRAYLERWGKRSDTVVELADPSWIEDPSILINNLKAYLQDNAVDPGIQWEGLVREREQLVAETRQKISGHPEPVRNQFEGLLIAGQHGQRLQEDHNWWIDQQGNHQVRQVFREFGRRLAAAGVVADEGDVFFLTGDEIKATTEAGLTGDLKSLVAARKSEMQHWGKTTPPLMLGTDYGPPPANPVTRAIGRFFGTPPAPPDPDHPEVISGVPGSPGRATGTARVIIRLADAERLGLGDILVTATTSPPWTPLFATAGGIVTDTGGALSHCAIVAREYGIPATVGTGIGTAAIKDGQRIEVDGDAGTVRLLNS